VGGPDFANFRVNLATDLPGRQPGSAFKAFTLMAALEQGFSPKDTILGTAPCPIPDPGSEDGVWSPDNVEDEAGGVLSLTDATVHSINCAFARLVKIIGPDKVVDVANRMGITNPLQPFLSLTLGGQDVTPLQMASGYATLAADGEHHEPFFVDHVDDRQGKLLFRSDSKGERAVSADNARIETQVLTQVVQRGTGRAAQVANWEIAGKTGTTDNHTNAWFVGYTPVLATAVWMGNPHTQNPDAPDARMTNVGGITVFGGTYPARIWHDYMSAALAGIPPVGFPPPESYPGGSEYRSVQNEKAFRADSSDSGSKKSSAGGTASVSPGTPANSPAPAPVLPQIPSAPEPQISVPARPQITIPPITIPQITIPERPTRPSRDG
jgi:penicillin-binding protein 1A